MAASIRVTFAGKSSKKFFLKLPSDMPFTEIRKRVDPVYKRTDYFFAIGEIEIPLSEEKTFILSEFIEEKKELVINLTDQDAVEAPIKPIEEREVQKAEVAKEITESRVIKEATREKEIKCTSELSSPKHAKKNSIESKATEVIEKGILQEEKKEVLKASLTTEKAIAQGEEIKQKHTENPIEEQDPDIDTSKSFYTQLKATIGTEGKLELKKSMFCDLLK